MLTLREARRLPLAAEVDILVAGGGPAGVAAAFAAARRLRRTSPGDPRVLVVEQFNCLGGVATAGGHGHICLFSAWGDRRRVVGGIPWEIARRIVSAGYGVCTTSQADFEIEGMRKVLEEMAEESGVGLLYHTFCSDTVVSRGRVIGAVIQNKSGRQWIHAQRVVDATGDGDVAAHAGCAFSVGDEETGLCQPMTLMFTIGGVDWPKVNAWRTSYEMREVWEEAQRQGDMRPYQKVIMGFWWTPTRPDQVGVNFTHINGMNACRAEDLTRATIEGRKQVFETIQVFRKYVPDMAHCYLISTPPTIGIRESRRIHGRYPLRKGDLLAQQTFPDSIGYGSFFIDIHNTKGPGMDAKTWRPPPGFRYQIPYRIMVPAETEGLWVAGRCASCDHEALGSLRVMPQCGVMGEAAGTAAVVSLEENCRASEVPIERLQTMLRVQGAILDEAGIEAACRADEERREAVS